MRFSWFRRWSRCSSERLSCATYSTRHPIIINICHLIDQNLGPLNNARIGVEYADARLINLRKSYGNTSPRLGDTIQISRWYISSRSSSIPNVECRVFLNFKLTNLFWLSRFTIFWIHVQDFRLAYVIISNSMTIACSFSQVLECWGQIMLTVYSNRLNCCVKFPRNSSHNSLTGKV